MKNKIRYKKYLLSSIIISVCILIIFLFINIYEYRIYTKNFNNKISDIVNCVQEKYLNITEQEIIEILNSEGKDNSMLLNKYGIGIEGKSIVTENDNVYNKFLKVNMIFIALSIVSLLIIFIIYNKNREKEIDDITKYIEELNKRNYSLKIDSNSEDELSILKNEIYKTTIMLKEAAENSYNDKLNIKKSLEDISHQIKTPLTSILVMLDDLIDDQDMDANIRNDFIIDIKRQIVNINFLIQAILKLSKFDSNTINFSKEKAELKNIVNEAIKNVSPLCDLRNISIEVDMEEGVVIICDFKWEVEAYTNILKNCIEHSKYNQKIEIKIGKYNVYAYAQIRDYGEGISEKDIKHIFERFYKGENASSESFGIGLALSKAIIEEDNGNIVVENEKEGSKFVIKYF